jgi:branched-subunit amino acid transport protein AzlD
MGKIFWLFSIVLAAYSLTRFVLTAWNIIKGRKLSTDPITRFLNFIVWILNENINETFRKLTQYISFGFMGYLMISSVRSFSINMKNLFDFVLRRRRLNILSTDTLVLLLSQVYGIYFLSAVILLQSSLPRTYV